MAEWVANRHGELKVLSSSPAKKLPIFQSLLSGLKSPTCCSNNLHSRGNSIGAPITMMSADFQHEPSKRCHIKTLPRHLRAEADQLASVTLGCNGNKLKEKKKIKVEDILMAIF